MAGRRLFIVIMLALAGLATPVLATTFTASVTPSTINATNSTLVNVTVSNTGAVNISSVTITLPLSFTYDGSQVTNATWTSFTAGTTSGGNKTLNWTATVVNGQANFFSFYTTAIVINSWNLNVSATDTNGAVTSSNVALTVNDITSPQWSSNTTSPSTAATYTQGGSYTFSIKWTDDINVSSVIFDWNGTANYTANTNPAVTNSSSVYSITLTNLAAGNYTYYWSATDTSSNTNTTQTPTYTINPATNSINQTINGVTNSNTIVTNATSYTISVAGIGNVILYQNSTQVASNSSCTSVCYLSYVFSPSTATGLYNFTTTAAGNANYSSGSATYFVFVSSTSVSIPTYTRSTDAPSTYSGTVSNFIVNINANPSSVLLAELNYTGSAINYTMFTKDLSTYNYNVSLPVGTFTWRTFFNQGGYSFFLNNTNITVSPATPPLNLNNTLWSVTYGVITNVSCTSPVTQITPNLYRDSSAVTNGDYQTLPIGNHLYLCNNTATQNYTSVAISKTLVVSAVTTYALQIVGLPAIVAVQQNATATASLAVQNIGTNFEQVTVSPNGINTNIWTVSPSALIAPNATVNFTVVFMPGSLNIGTYPGNWVASGPDTSTNASFVLQVTPSNATIANLTSLATIFTTQYNTFAAKINQTSGVNQTVALGDLAKLNSLIVLFNQYISQKDYLNAFLVSQQINALMQKLTGDLNPQNAPPMPINWPLYAVIGGVAAVVVFLVYLFLPARNAPPGVKPLKQKEFKYDYRRENG